MSCWGWSTMKCNNGIGTRKDVRQEGRRGLLAGAVKNGKENFIF